MAIDDLIIDFPGDRSRPRSMPSPASARVSPSSGEQVSQQPRRHHRFSRSNSVEPSPQRVSFSESTKVKVVVDVSTKDVMPDLYYSKSDIQSIKHGIRRKLMGIKARGLTLAEYAKQNRDQTEVFMGLEAHLDEKSLLEVYTRRRQLRSAIMREQRRQLDKTGVIDIAKLARVAERESEWARVRARVIGMIHDDHH
mmetsp:Transcript_73/g.149  ORF Transcript_73/g.149 Transcript_73/m.149 type:complete len:196 (-) Transcript_73:54-641(-)